MYEKDDKRRLYWLMDQYVSGQINEENFFSKTEAERYDFLKRACIEKMDLLEEVVKKRKLDTNMEKLQKDLREVLEFKPEE